MADVSVQIAGRSYRLGCDDGEEAHLIALAHELDTVAGELTSRMSAPPEEPRLMLMIALMMADRVRESEARAEAAASPGMEQTATRIAALAERIETAARSVAGR